MDIQLPQQQEPESPCWGPTLHTCPSHFRRTTGYYTEKNSSQHYLPHPWPPTTISEAGEVPWSHSIGQTILDPTHWDGHQKGEQHTGFSPSEHFQMSKRCQGEMLQKLAPTSNMQALHGTPTTWATYSNWKQYKDEPPILSVEATTLRAVFHTW